MLILQDMFRIKWSMERNDKINSLMASVPLTDPETELRYLLLDYNQPLAYEPEFDPKEKIFDNTGSLELEGYLYNSTAFSSKRLIVSIFRYISIINFISSFGIFSSCSLFDEHFTIEMQLNQDKISFAGRNSHLGRHAGLHLHIYRRSKPSILENRLA